jgi:transcriptional regulator with XRE-family HTH domain
LAVRIDKFKVKELMAKKKIKNQTELAKILGISKNQLSNILSEKYSPIKSNIVELAEFLGVSALEILKEEENELHRK